MLLQMALFHSFLWLYSIPLYTHNGKHLSWLPGKPISWWEDWKFQSHNPGLQGGKRGCRSHQLLMAHGLISLPHRRTSIRKKGWDSERFLVGEHVGAGRGGPGISTPSTHLTLCISSSECSSVMFFTVFKLGIWEIKCFFQFCGTL